MEEKFKKEDWQEIQDEFYADAEKHTHLEFDPGSVYAKDLVDHMVKAIDISRSKTVLEIGAGAGRFSLHLIPHCGKLVALDTSRALLDALKREAPQHGNLDVICASVFDLARDTVPGFFDAVCGFFILHHLPDHEKLFALISQTLKSGGRVCFMSRIGSTPFS